MKTLTEGIDGLLEGRSKHSREVHEPSPKTAAFSGLKRKWDKLVQTTVDHLIKTGTGEIPKKRYKTPEGKKEAMRRAILAVFKANFTDRYNPFWEQAAGIFDDAEINDAEDVVELGLTFGVKHNLLKRDLKQHPAKDIWEKTLEDPLNDLWKKLFKAFVADVVEGLAANGYKVGYPAIKWR